MSEWDCSCDVHKCCFIKFVCGTIDSALEHVMEAIRTSFYETIPHQVKHEIVDECPMQGSSSTPDSISSMSIAAYPILFGSKISRLNVAGHQLYMCHPNCLSKVKNILELLHVQYDGIAMQQNFNSHSKMAWHLTESGGNNEMACRVHNSWFVVPGKYTTQFNKIVTYLLNLNISRIRFMNLLGYDSPNVKISPLQFDLRDLLMIMPQQSETAIPRAPHFGMHNVFMHGDCSSYRMEESKLSDSLSVSSGCFESFSSTSSLSSLQTTNSTDDVTDDMNLDNILIKCEEESQDNNQASTDSDNGGQYGSKGMTKSLNQSSSSVPPESEEVCTCVGDLLIECSVCPQVYKGGENRVERMIQHALRCHKDHGESLVRQLRFKYPIRPCPRYTKCKRIKKAAFCSLSRKVVNAKFLPRKKP